MVIRKNLVAAAVACLLGTLSADPALAQSTYQFNLPEQSLADSLRAIARQATMNVLFEPSSVEKLRAPAVNGTLSAEQAIKLAIAGTGLVVQGMDGNSVIIGTEERLNRTRTSTSRVALEKTSWRVAQADTTQRSETSSTSARASEVRDDDIALAEVVVTAQKREERLIDVPISIMVINNDAMKTRQLNDLEDLAIAVPGMSIQSSGGYQRRVQIRGVSNTYGVWPSIGMYLDEAPVTSLQASQLPLNAHDLERIEVLRGPQGTLFGEGSSGGTLRFITKNPNLSEFGFEADVATLFTEGGSPSGRLQSVVNLPISENTLGIRIAGTIDHDAGWIDQPAAGDDDYNDTDIADVRAKVLWTPSSTFSVSGLAEVHRQEGGVNFGEDESGNFSQRFGQITSPEVKSDFEIYNLTANYDAGAVTLLSSTSYFDQRGTPRYIGFIFPAAPPPALAFDDIVDNNTTGGGITSFGQELRLSSSGSGPWQWTIGAFYRELRSDATPFRVFLGFPGPLPAPIPIPGSKLKSEAWSGFLNTSLAITGRITIGAGVRYFHDDQVSHANVNTPFASTQTGTFTSTNPRAYIEYKVVDNVNIYASAAKGFRSGGFNAVGVPTFAPESVWTYELGAKSSLDNGTLSLEGSAFRSDLENYQFTGSEVINNVLRSITSTNGDARIDGVEASILWRAGEDWLIGTDASVTDAKITRIDAFPAAFAAGDRLNLVPKYHVSASVQREFVFQDKPGSFRLEYNQQGKSVFRNRIYGPHFVSYSDVMNMLNANVTLDWRDNISFSVFAQNLTNERGYQDAYSVQLLAPRPRPRSYGASFGMKF